MTKTSDNADHMHDPAHLDHMRLAFEQAELAAKRDEVPIGAVIIDRLSGKVLAAHGNRTRELSDPSAHGEILAIRDVCSQLGVQRIPQCDLYVTLEPCPMCAAAISFARIGHIYIGALDAKSGGIYSGPQIYHSPALHHKPSTSHGIMAQECGDILQQFFQQKRNAAKQSGAKNNAATDKKG